MDGKQKFWRNFRSLAGANVAALAIMVGLAPILGWIYPPESFGYLAYFMFTFQMLTSISICRADWLLPNAKSLTEELGLFIWGVIALSLICTVALIVFLFPPAILTQWEGYQAVGRLLALVPFAVFGMGLRLLWTARFVRSSELRPVSHVKILETLGNAGSSILFGLLGMLTSGLVWARVISSWVGVFHLARKAPIKRAELGRVTRARMRHILKRHWWSAARSTLVSFTNTLSTNAAILVLGAVSGAAELGLYLMTTRLISTPVQLGAKALSQSFWARSAELARTKQFVEMRREYLGLVLKLFLIALGFVLVLICVGLFIEDFFPPRWAGLGATFIAFTPMVLGIVTIGSTNHLIVFDKPQFQLVADITRLALMSVSVLALARTDAPFWQLVLAVSLASLTGHVVLFCMHLYAYQRAIAARREAP